MHEQGSEVWTGSQETREEEPKPQEQVRAQQDVEQMLQYSVVRVGSFLH